MAEEKPQTGYCGPSQVTINIGTSGVKINDDTKPAPAPGVDLTKYVTREVADTLYAPRTLVDYATSEAQKAAAAAAEAKGKVLVIDPGFPIPKDTAVGTLVVRPRAILEAAHRQFAPVSAWHRFAGVTLENDGLHVRLQAPAAGFIVHGVSVDYIAEAE